MPKKKAKEKGFELDTAGWLFWGVMLLLLTGPAIFGAWQITHRTSPAFIPIGMGIVSAAVGAGVVSWAVNAMLEMRRKKRRIAERKRTRKVRKRK